MSKKITMKGTIWEGNEWYTTVRLSQGFYLHVSHSNPPSFNLYASTASGMYQLSQDHDRGSLGWTTAAGAHMIDLDKIPGEPTLSQGTVEGGVAWFAWGRGLGDLPNALSEDPLLAGLEIGDVDHMADQGRLLLDEIMAIAAFPWSKNKNARR